jgi:hypothetical protein
MAWSSVHHLLRAYEGFPKMIVRRQDIRARQSVPVWIVNVTDRGQALSAGNTAGHCELVT